MNKIKNVVFSFLLCFFLGMTSISAMEKISTSPTEKVEVVEKVEELDFFEKIYYRLFEKDTKDFFDYSLLGVFIVGLLIVMVFQNTHYKIVKSVMKSESIEAPAIETVKIETNEELKEEIDPSEILPSELLEEEASSEPEVKKPKKKKNQSS